MPATDPLDELDTETRALLDALDVPLAAAAAPASAVECDLDVAFGTPLALHEVWALPAEAALLSPTDPSLNANTVVGDFLARRQAALDIVADDPHLTARVRERLVDVLLPAARQLRIDRRARPFAEPEVLAA
ncbi:hypothetical protein [Streptomyces sp. NPDC001054]